jgi:hypothetical protein
MNAAELKSCNIIEKTLSQYKAYRKIEDQLYVIRQGSTYVMITVVPWGDDRAIVRCVAQLVKGVKMRTELALQLLELNAILRFGGFAYVKEGSLIIFLHSILGGETMDPSELLATIRDVALIADHWDDKIIETYGGQRMQDLLEESALAKLLGTDPNIPKDDE